MKLLAQGLRAVTRYGMLLRELRGIRQELTRQGVIGERIAAALELSNAHNWPQQIQGSAAVPPVEVTYADDEREQRLMEIELRLTSALGRPPEDTEVLEEYERRFSEELG